jgi:hypothetical protein
MEKAENSEGAHWRFALKFLGLLGLFAALIQLGATSLVLKNELKKAECRATYWKGIVQKQPSNYCPSGCECDVRMLR